MQVPLSISCQRFHIYSLVNEPKQVARIRDCGLLWRKLQRSEMTWHIARGSVAVVLRHLIDVVLQMSQVRPILYVLNLIFFCDRVLCNGAIWVAMVNTSSRGFRDSPQGIQLGHRGVGAQYPKANWKPSVALMTRAQKENCWLKAKAHVLKLGKTMGMQIPLSMCCQRLHICSLVTETPYLFAGECTWAGATNMNLQPAVVNTPAKWEDVTAFKGSSCCVFKAIRC